VKLLLTPDTSIKDALERVMPIVREIFLFQAFFLNSRCGSYYLHNEMIVLSHDAKKTFRRRRHAEYDNSRQLDYNLNCW
jgi:hypothetical protein